MKGCILVLLIVVIWCGIGWYLNSTDRPEDIMGIPDYICIPIWLFGSVIFFIIVGFLIFVEGVDTLFG